MREIIPTARHSSSIETALAAEDASAVFFFGTGRMSVERKFRTALDETRLLMLGAQILYGFEFESAFQAGIETASRTLRLRPLTVGLLIAPSARHRIAKNGAIDKAMFAYVRLRSRSCWTTQASVSVWRESRSSCYWGSGTSILCCSRASAGGSLIKTKPPNLAVRRLASAVSRSVSVRRTRGTPSIPVPA